MMMSSSSWVRGTLFSAACLLVAPVLTGCNGGAAANGPQPNNGGGTEPAPGGGHGDCGSNKLCGQAAPEIEGEYVAGDGPKTLAEAKGTVVVVDFWGTFCEPCKKSFPKYQELGEAKGSSLAIIAVSVDDPDDATAADIQKFGEDLGVSFPLIWDKDKKTAPQYEPGTMPTSYVIDKEGKVRHVHTGYKPGEEEEISKEIDALLAE